MSHPDPAVSAAPAGRFPRLKEDWWAVIVGLLWKEATPARLAGWGMLAVGLSAARFSVLARYEREVVQRGAEDHLAFFRAHRLVWPLSALSWGLTTLLFFDRAPLPDQFKHLGSVEFSKRLMEGAEIAVAPGAGFGEYGDGFVRIALVENEQRIRQAARNLKKFLHSNAAPAAAE